MPLTIENGDTIDEFSQSVLLKMKPEVLAFLLMPLKHLNVKKWWDLIKKVLIEHNYTSHPPLFRFYKDTVRKVILENNYDAVESPIVGNEQCMREFASITDFLPNGFFNIKNTFEKCLKNIFYLIKYLSYNGKRF